MQTTLDLYSIVGVTLVIALASFALGRRRSESLLRFKPLEIEELRRVPYFKKLSSAHLAKVSTLVRELRVPADAYIIREHHAGEALFLVVEGKLHILKRGTDVDTLVKSVSAGEFIGEMSLLNGTRTVASARATTSSVLLQIDREDFVEFLNADDDIAKAVWNACEIHTIDLLLRDHEPLRAMTIEQREKWIAHRRSQDLAVGKSIKSAQACYVTLVAGEVRLGEQFVIAPHLLRLEAGQELVCRSKARLAWMPEPPHLARTAA